jgi:SAM-dependent methyltransferase
MNILDIFKLAMSQGPVNTMVFLSDWQVSIRMYYLYAAIESGLISALRTPATKAALLATLLVENEEMLDALLDVGLATGELALKRGHYRLKGRRSRALVDDKDEIFTGMIQANVTFYHETFHDSPARIKGAPLADLLGKYADLIAKFSRSSEPFVLDFLCREAKKKNASSLLEIGCGSGIHMRSAAQANPRIRGIGIDIDPRVAKDAMDNMTAWGIKDRFTVVTGDIRNPPDEIKGPFDIVTLFNLIYYFPEKERPELLKRLRELLSNDGRLLLVSFMASKGRDPMGAALNLATSSERGCTPLPDEEMLTSQLKEAGFQKIERKRLIPKSSMIGLAARM